MSDDNLSADPTPELTGLLARTEVWEDGPDLEQMVVEAIAAERSQQPDQLAEQRQRRRHTVTRRWLAAAAAVVVFAGGALVIRAVGEESSETAGGVESHLGGTSLAPDANATAVLTSTPAGLVIVLDVDGLPGAAPNEMYEAWISDGTIGVSAGTFHLRQGDGPIELWAGVADPTFHRIAVTREPVDGVAASSGDVVLQGEFTLQP